MLWIWVDTEEDRAKRIVALYERNGVRVRAVSREQDLPEQEVQLAILTPGWPDSFAQYLRERYGVPVLLAVPGGAGLAAVPDAYDEVVPCPAKVEYLQKWAGSTRKSDEPKASEPSASAPNPLERLEQLIESTSRKRTYTQKQQTIAFERPTEEIAKRATVITVAGVKGGVGKSTVAILLASQLHRKGSRTVLADLDHMGNLARLLEVNPVVDTDRFEVLANSLTDAEMEQNLTRTAYGFYLVPRGAKNAQGLSADGTRRLIYLLSHYADYVILDTHPGRVVSTAEAMKGADVVCAVSTTDRSTWADLREFFQVTSKPVKIVLNRTREKPAALADMRQILSKETGFPVIGALPEDETLYAKVQAGERIEGSARLEAAMKDLRVQLFGPPKESEKADAERRKKPWGFR